MRCLSSSGKETAPPSPWPTTASPSAATLLAFPLRVPPLREHHRLTSKLLASNFFTFFLLFLVTIMIQFIQ